VPATKEKKPVKGKIRGFAVDPHTDALIVAGARAIRGTKSEFLRQAVQKYFEE
tara:strand:+ start:3816 stop:3974 length:159 start_codon:yes stop_codon:yes gene_type:complete